MSGTFATPPLEGSARWAEGLRRGGRDREEALLGLRAHLIAAALFELRRRAPGGGLQEREACRLVRDAAEAALAAILTDLGRYRSQSAFATWTAKYAIREAASAAREAGIAGPAGTGATR
jgi:hypothetical protein